MMLWESAGARARRRQEIKHTDIDPADSSIHFLRSRRDCYVLLKTLLQINIKQSRCRVLKVSRSLVMFRWLINTILP